MGNVMYIIYFHQLDSVESNNAKGVKDGKNNLPDTELGGVRYSDILSIGVFLLNIRLVQVLAVLSKNFRGTLTIFSQATIDIVYFLIFLYVFILFLAVSKHILKDDPKEGDPPLNLVSTLVGAYQIMFGENPDTSDIVEGNSIKFEFWFYLIHTNTINVICLNILISIVTDNYDNVQSRMNAIDYKQKAAILLQHEQVMYWNREVYDPQYLFLMRYKKDGIDGFSGDEEWQGKMRSLKNSVMMVQEVVTKKVEKQDMKVVKVDRSIGEVTSMINDEVQRVKDKLKMAEEGLEAIFRDIDE